MTHEHTALRDALAQLSMVDWSATPLGSVDQWDLRLRVVAGLVLRQPSPNCLLWGASGTIIFNAAWQALLPPGRSGDLGKSLFQVNEGLTRHYAQAMSGMGEGSALADGFLPMSWRILADAPGSFLSCVAVPGDDGAPVGLLLGRVIGPRLASQDRERQHGPRGFRLQLSDVLRHLENPEEIQKTGLHMLGAFLNADRASLAEVDLNAGKVRELHEYRRDPAAAPHKTTHQLEPAGAALDLLRKGMPVVIKDTRSAGNALAEAVTAEVMRHAVVPFRAELTVPIMRADTLVSVMTMRFDEPHDWDAEEIAITHEAASRVWEAIERARAEEAFHRVETRLRLAQKAAGVATFDWEVGSRTVTWSPEALGMLGLRTGELGGTFEDWIATIHPDDLPHARDHIEWALEDGELEGEWRVLRPDGSVIFVLVRGTVERDAQNQAMHLFGAQIDVTDRVRSEQDTRALLADLGAQIKELRRRLDRDGK